MIKAGATRKDAPVFTALLSFTIAEFNNWELGMGNGEWRFKSFGFV